MNCKDLPLQLEKSLKDITLYFYFKILSNHKKFYQIHKTNSKPLIQDLPLKEGLFYLYLYMSNSQKYPKIKYRVVNGNGYVLCNNWKDVEKLINLYKTDPNFKDKERFQVKYIVKITEEIIEI